MRTLNQLRDRKAQLRKALKVNQKEIGLDFLSLRWNILMDLGLDFFSFFLSGKKKKNEDPKSDEE